MNNVYFTIDIRAILNYILQFTKKKKKFQNPI